MIKAYVVGIESLYEGEDIEIRYRVYKDGDLLKEKAFYDNYTKPILVTQLAMLSVLRFLENYRDQEIELIINDGATYSLIEKTSSPKNLEAIKMAKTTRRKLKEFQNLSLINVSADHKQIEDWDNKLTF